jgi:hypothetical protein
MAQARGRVSKGAACSGRRAVASAAAPAAPRRASMLRAPRDLKAPGTTVLKAQPPTS